MAKLDGRVAIVTGAGRYKGIGRAAAIRLAAEGAAVVVVERTAETSRFPAEEQSMGWLGARSVVAEIEQAGGRAISQTCNVTKPDQVAALFARATEAFGVPDAIVNNAGLLREADMVSILDVEDEDWHRLIDVNLNGTYHIAKAAARAMLVAGKPGAILNIASMAGRQGVANLGGYSASKFAVIGLTQQMALELARHSIRVNAICPGLVDTDMMHEGLTMAERSSGATIERLRMSGQQRIPMGRYGDPGEQAAVIAFLLGPDASYITGQSLNVDGGMRLN